MMTPLLQGAIAGLLSAVLFAAAGAADIPMAARLPLFLLTPLPIALAGLGLGWRMGAVAGAVAAAGVFAAAGPRLALLFSATDAVPIVALAYLALLNRPSPSARAVEWYPVGRLVIWTSVFAGALALLTLLMLGSDAETVRQTMRSLLEAFLKTQFPEGLAGADGQPLAAGDIDDLTAAMLGIFPAFMAMSSMSGLLLTLWLSGRILLAAGRLERPWPDLAALRYPRGTSLALVPLMMAALALDGYPALAAAGFAGALFFAWVLAGLAILHYVTRGQAWRPFALWALYAALLVMGWFLAPLAAMLGLVDAIVPLRRPPPSAPNPTSKNER